MIYILLQHAAVVAAVTAVAADIAAASVVAASAAVLAAVPPPTHLWQMSVLIELDGLVASVVARHVALAAVDAKLGIDQGNHVLSANKIIFILLFWGKCVVLWIFLLVVQVVVGADALQRPPDDLANLGDLMGKQNYCQFAV